MEVLNKSSTLSRRRFLHLIGGLALVPSLAGCAQEASPITVGAHVWPGYEPMYLAKAMGWLDPKLVTLIEDQSATHSIELLKQGKIEAAALTLDEVLRAREDGIPLSVILVCDISVGADVLLARPHIRTLAGIKGLRIAVEDGALGALMLRKALEAAGLKPGDVTPVSLTVDQHVAAWKDGSVDAAVTYEPASSRIIALGANKLFDSRSIPDTILDVLAVRTELLDGTYDETLRHLVAAHLKGLRYLNSSPEDAAYRMASDFKLPPEQVMATFRGLLLPELDYNRRLFAGTAPPFLDTARRVADIMLSAGILKKPADLQGLLYPEYLPQEGI